MDTQAQILARLDRIERRLALLEAGWKDRPSTSPPPPESAAAAPSTPGVAHRTYAPIPAPTPVAGPAARQTRRPPPPPARPAASRGGPQTARRAPSADAKKLEALVGGWWFAVLGAVIVVAGLGFGVKLAWDAGWFRLGETARVLVVAGFGAVLLGAGEVVLRKWGRAAALGLFAAGLGALYIAAWAASGLYDLVPTGASFAMLALVALAGIAISVRAGLLSIGIVALVGGYAAPFLAASPNPEPWALPAYLVTLTCVGMGLAWWKRSYEPVRIVCWALTVLVSTVWFVVSGGDMPWLAVGFPLGLWGLYHADAFRRSARGGTVQDAASEADERPIPVRVGEVFTLIGSVGLTAWSAIISTVACFAWTAAPEWAPTAVLAVASGVLSFVLAGHLRFMADKPRTPAERLGAVLMVQAGGLLIASVTIGVDVRWVRSVAWLAMGVAACVGARWMRSIALGVYGLALVALATGLLVLIAQFGVPAGWGRLDRFGLVLTPWTVLMLAAGGSWIAGSRLMDWWTKPGSVRPNAVFAMLCTVGVLVAGLSVAHEQTEPAALAWVWALVALGAVAAGFVWRRSGAEFGGLVWLAGALLAWLGSYPLQGWDEFSGALGLHPGLWSAFLLIGVAVGVGLLLARLHRARSWPADGIGEGFALGAGGLLVVSTSLEVARGAELLLAEDTAQRGAVSIWWGIFAAGLLVLGAVRRMPGVRWCGLGLMLIAAAKAVIFDLAAVDPAVRVASFLGLGVLMLVVAVMYARAQLRAKNSQESRENGEDSSDSTNDERGASMQGVSSDRKDFDTDAWSD